jgi:hypothetical protein
MREKGAPVADQFMLLARLPASFDEWVENRERAGLGGFSEPAAVGQPGGLGAALHQEAVR